MLHKVRLIKKYLLVQVKNGQEGGGKADKIVLKDLINNWVRWSVTFTLLIEIKLLFSNLWEDHMNKMFATIKMTIDKSPITLRFNCFLEWPNTSKVKGEGPFQALDDMSTRNPGCSTPRYWLIQKLFLALIQILFLGPWNCYTFCFFVDRDLGNPQNTT